MTPLPRRLRSRSRRPCPAPYSNTATVSTTAVDNNGANDGTTQAFTALPARAIPVMSPTMLALLGGALAAIALTLECHPENDGCSHAVPPFESVTFART